MKNLQLNLLTILAISLSARAQIENVRFNEDLNFEKIYVGFDSKMIVPNDSLVAITSTTIRIGSALSWNLDELFSMYAHGALNWSDDHQSYAITTFVFNIKPTNGLKIGVGFPPTATGFTRAHPLTWKNQSESYAQSRSPGNKPGILIQYSFLEKFRIAYSYQNLDGSTWSNHLNLKIGKFSIAGYVQEDNSSYLSMRLNTEIIDANYNYTSDRKEHSSSVFYNLSKDYSVFYDLNYRSGLQDLERSEESKIEVASLGLRKYLLDNHFHTGGFIAAAYDIAQRQSSIRLFFFLK